MTEGATGHMDESGLRGRLARLTPEQRRTLKARLTGDDPAASFELPLTAVQFGIWLFEQLSPGSTAYHNPAALRLRGSLDVDALRRVLRFMAARHEALRARIVEDDEGLPQYVPVDGDPVGLRVTETRGDGDDMVLGAVTEAARRPFDLGRGPLWHTDLLRIAPGDHVLVVTFHHVISDGWTLGIFLREFLAAYEAMAAGRAPGLPCPRYSYADALRAVAVPSARRARVLEHWKERLADAPRGVSLPGGASGDGDVRGGSRVFVLEAATAAGLRAVARRAGTSEFSAVAAVFAGWLGRWCGQDDLVVTTVVADREAPETQDAIGCFINTVPLRVRLPAVGDWGTLLRRTGAAVTDALAHADVPFGEIAAAVGESSRGEAAISNVMVLHANADLRPREAAGLRLSRMQIPLIASKHDLGLLVTTGADTITCELEYRQHVLTENQVGGAVRALRADAARAAAWAG